MISEKSIVMADIDYNGKKLSNYEKDMAERMPVTTYGWDGENNSWKCGLGLEHLFSEGFRPETLDPYIKEYVLLLIDIGMQTVWSCDGWHTSAKRNKEMQLCFLDRYSAIWHGILFDEAVKNVSFPGAPFRWKDRGDLRNLHSTLPKDDAGKLKIYLITAYDSKDTDRTDPIYSGEHTGIYGGTVSKPRITNYRFVSIENPDDVMDDGTEYVMLYDESDAAVRCTFIQETSSGTRLGKVEVADLHLHDTVDLSVIAPKGYEPDEERNGIAVYIVNDVSDDCSLVIYYKKMDS